MKTYKIFDDVELEIKNKVTPRDIKELRALGFDIKGMTVDTIYVAIDIFTGEEDEDFLRLRKLVEIVFGYKVVKTNEEIDGSINLNEIGNGIRDFFFKPLPFLYVSPS